MQRLEGVDEAILCGWNTEIESGSDEGWEVNTCSYPPEHNGSFISWKVHAILVLTLNIHICPEA